MQNNPISSLKHSVPVASLRGNPEDVYVMCVCVCVCVCVSVSDGVDAVGGKAQNGLVNSIQLC